MRSDKQQAFLLRKSGKTYSEIKEALSVPKSTLSDWFRDQTWSNDIAEKNIEKAMKASKIRLVALGKIRGKHLEKVYEQARIEAAEDYQKLKYHPLFISGLMVYWGEGDKASKHKVFIANTDPKMIKIFSLFLKHICGVEKQKAWILSYPDLNEQECKQYWVNNAGLSYEYFTKTIVIKGKSVSKRLKYGVCNIGVSGAYLKRKVMVWIGLLSKDVISGIY